MPSLYEFHSINENINFSLNHGLDFMEFNFGYVREDIINNPITKSNLPFTLHFFDAADFKINDEVVIENIKTTPFILKVFFDLKEYNGLTKGKNVVIEIENKNTLINSIHYFRRIGDSL